MPRLAFGGNKLLQIARPDDLAFLAARGDRRYFHRGDLLNRADERSEIVYFVESGIASVVKRHGDRRTEICLLGPEGFTGAAILLADGCSPYETFVQSEMLVAFGIDAPSLHELIKASPAFHRLLLQSIHVRMVQVAENLATAAWEPSTVRLARWLLMYHDRVGTPQLGVTHEFMAMMIGAQRTKVTAALHAIEAEGAISAVRGRVTVKDATILERLADGTYGCAEAESKRLLSANPRRS